LFLAFGGSCQPALVEQSNPHSNGRAADLSSTTTTANIRDEPEHVLRRSTQEPPQNDQTLPPRGSARASHTPCMPPHHTLSSQQIQNSLSARCMRRLSPCHPGTLISPHPRSQAATINQNKGGGGGHPPQLSRAPPGGASPREPPPELQGHAPDSAHARTLALPAPSLLLLLLLLLLLRAPPPLPPRASLSAPRPLSRLRRA
jgi:hypothetical protein